MCYSAYSLHGFVDFLVALKSFAEMSGGKPKGFGFGGFTVKTKGQSVETQLAQMGYGLPGMPGRSHNSVLHIGKKRVRTEDELVNFHASYFLFNFEDLVIIFQ